MNYRIVALGIILLLLIYVLYWYVFNRNVSLSSSKTLYSVNTPITSISSPTSYIYSYGIWVYVNSWDSNIVKTIFSRDQNIKLYLGKSEPTLNCNINLNNRVESVEITDNFPMQKWVHIIVSLDNDFFDAYIDGKLVKSVKLQNIVKTPSATAPIILGSIQSTGVFDAYVSKFVRWTFAMDPQTAWNNYMAGNGSSTFFSNYNANLTILQNNAEYQKVNLF